MDSSKQLQSYDQGSVYVPNKSGVYEFIIHEWFMLPTITGKAIASPTFSIAGSDLWVLEIYPHGADVKDEGFVSVALRNVSNELCKVSCNLLFRDKTEEFHCMAHTTATDIGPLTTAPNDNNAWFAHRIMSEAEAGGLCAINNNTFVTKLEMTVAFAPQSSESNIASRSRETTLTQDLSLLINGFRTDVILWSENEKVHCHQCILGARSPYFERIFSSTMTHMKMGLVGERLHVPHVPSFCLYEFVRFIYTNECSSNEVLEFVENGKNELLFGMYRSSIHYMVNSLQQRCEQILISSITANSICDLLLLALESLASGRLKLACITFVGSHVADVVKSTRFNELDGEICRDLLAEIAGAPQVSEYNPISGICSQGLADENVAKNS